MATVAILRAVTYRNSAGGPPNKSLDGWRNRLHHKSVNGESLIRNPSNSLTHSMPASPLVLLVGALAALLLITLISWRAFRLARELRQTREHLALVTNAPGGPPAGLSSEWLALCARSAQDALWNWDIIGDRVHFSDRWRELVGLPAQEVDRSTEEWWARVHPSDQGQLHVDLAAQLAGAGSRFAAEHRIRHEDGRWLRLQWTGVILRDGEGRALRVAGSVRDVTAQHAAAERQRRDALYDPLTGLPNRALAIDLLRRAIKRTHRQGERRFAALLVDVDRFNLLNDSLGHQAGDELLRGVALRLATAIRPGDVIARLGGDEFLLLLDEITDVADAESVADRVKLVLADPIRVISTDIVVTASIGIVLHDVAQEQPTDYLRDAELAMHGAKRNGRARHECFVPEMRDGVRRRMSIEQDLRGAIERSEFFLLYQPIWDVRNGIEKLLGFEALVRWNHPKKGILGPGEFVPIAEESEMIVGLGLWAIGRACRDVRELAPNGPGAPWVSVNLAARQLADRRLLASVDEILADSELVASRLKLEVTENVILHDEETARLVLEALRDRGVRALMDDFGTGHASLSYLHRLPIGTIKIDRYFVGRMDVSPECLEIVRSIITLAASLGMEVVAEGVEQEAQLAQLRALGCQSVQGFLLARPLLAEESHALVAAIEGQGGFCPRSVLRDLGLAGGHRLSVEGPSADEAAA